MKKTQFRDFLRKELRRLDFYTRHGDRYFISEFAHQNGLSEVSVGRYIRDNDPVTPTADVCRDLAVALGLQPCEVQCKAGHVNRDDLVSWAREWARKAIDNGEFDSYFGARLDAQREAAALALAG